MPDKPSLRERIFLYPLLIGLVFVTTGRDAQVWQATAIVPSALNLAQEERAYQDPDPDTDLDTALDVLSFTDIEYALVDTEYRSNTVTLKGFDGTLVAQVNGGNATSLIINGVDLGSRDCQVRTGDTLGIKTTSASSVGQTIRLDVTVGMTTVSWNITTAPAIGPLPDVPGTPSGSTAGELAVNERGAAIYRIPLTIVPGTRGVQPSLSLQYDSQSGVGLLGAGWSLTGLSLITRCGLADTDATGSLLYCLDGERLIAVKDSAGNDLMTRQRQEAVYGGDGVEYRTEREIFSRVISHDSNGDRQPEYFTVETKAGMRLEYGATEGSRIEGKWRIEPKPAPQTLGLHHPRVWPPDLHKGFSLDGPTPTLSAWAVNRLEDSLGNYLTVSYFEDDTQRVPRPQRVDYTGNDREGLRPYASVEFAYDNRPDRDPKSSDGSLVKTPKRLSTLRVLHGTEIVREYRLSYEEGASTGRSRLVSVEQCSRKRCLEPTILDWSEGPESQTTAPETPDLLTRIRPPHGVEIGITYDFLPRNATSSDRSRVANLEPTARRQFPLVSYYTRSDGVGGDRRFDYHYTGATFSRDGRDLSGFSSIKISDETSGIVTINQYETDHRYSGLLLAKRLYEPGGVLVSSVENVLALEDFGGSGRYFGYVAGTAQMTFELDGHEVTKTLTSNSYDRYGNLTRRRVEYQEGHTHTTRKTYVNNVETWLLGRLTETRIEKQSPGLPAVVTRSIFEHDVSSGLLTQETVEPGHPKLELVKDYQRDGYGNIKRTTVSGPELTARTQWTTYDHRGRFMVSRRNALGHEETRTYDAASGNLESATGPNGTTTRWEYDELGRQVRELRADGTERKTAYRQCGGDSGCPSMAVRFVSDQSSGTAASRVYFDRLNREVRLETVGLGGKKIYVDTEYSPKGEVKRVSEPYFAKPTLWTEFEYDALGRLVLQKAPGNREVSISYSGLTTTTTNVLKQVQTIVLNSLSQPLRRVDDTGENVFHRYDSAGNLAEVEDSEGNVTRRDHDVRGNVLSLDDPNAGVTTYEHNAYGELTLQTDANGNAMALSYDVLGRPSERIEPEGMTTWEYDSQPNGVGKLARIIGPGGYMQESRYDSLGRDLETLTTIDGETFSIHTTYDQFGRLDALTYPSGLAVQHVYQKVQGQETGHLSRIERMSDGNIYWMVEEVNARGRQEKVSLGNGLVTSYGYEAKGGWLKTIRTEPAGGTLAVQDLGFQFDELGNLTERKQCNTFNVENFLYDNLNRLVSAKVAGISQVCATYDELGNILSKSDVGTYSYGTNGAGPHAVTSISGPRPNTYAYDARGNRVSSSGGRVQYTSFNKPQTIVKGANELTFRYGPKRERYHQTIETDTGEEFLTYIGDGLYERVLGPGGAREDHYIHALGEVVAIERNELGRNEILYLHKDHLGSLSSITNEEGQVVEQLSYDAWGARRNADWTPTPGSITSSVNRGFNGQEMLDAVDLMFLNGRLYDPVISRFLSPALNDQPPYHPQSLNPYSFALNNPASQVPSVNPFSGLEATFPPRD